MALTYWWPFIEDGHNQGLKSSQSLSSLTFNNNGKLGKCLELTSALDLSINMTDIDVYNYSDTEVSYSLWVKIDKDFINNYIATDPDGYISDTSEGSKDKIIINRVMGLSIGSSGSGIYIDVISGTSNQLTTASILNSMYFHVGLYRDGSLSSFDSVLLLLDQWYHIVVTYDKLGNLKFYINGELQSQTQKSHGALSSSLYNNYLGLNIRRYGATNSTTNKRILINLKEYFNDVRVYNHALSAQEVAELAKGLVLHYHLDNNGLGRENLLSNSSGYEGTYNWIKSNNNGLISYGNENGVSYLITKRTNDSSSVSFSVQNQSIKTENFPLKAGDTFVVSGYYKVPSTEDYTVRGRIVVKFYDTGSTGDNYNTIDFYTGTSVANTIKDKWIYFEKTGIVPLTYVDGDVYFYLSYFTKGLSTVYWKQVKMEVGEYATPWCPAKVDALYNIVNDTKVYDCSGFGNNGTVISSLGAAAPSPRYSSVNVFNGIDGGILTNTELSQVFNNQFTMSFWVKHDSSDINARSVYFSNYNASPYFAIEKNTDNQVRISWNGAPDASFTNTQIDTNWHFITIVRDNNSYITVYVDGEFKEQDTNANWAVAKNLTNTWRLGRDTRTTDGIPLCGNMSDFRIYATELSANDILNLYKTSMLIDTNGNVSPRGVS